MKENKYSSTSAQRLKQCDLRLQDVFNTVLETIDHTIITGGRDGVTQNEMFRTGKSKVQFPNSKHNSAPSMAVDAAPYPIDWKDRERATLFAGFVMGIAKEKGITLRWGGDWNSDWQVKDNHFDDLWHFEITEGIV